MTPRVRRQSWIVFGLFWLVYGLLIRRSDLEAHGLQQAVVESLVERGSFGVMTSRQPMLRAIGDVFLWRGEWLPAKQPGQFVMGALVYWPLHRLGLDYVNDYLLVAWCVTFFTASFLTALSCAFFHDLIERTWGLPAVTAGYAVACYGLSTMLLAYAGVPSHDVIAAALVTIAVASIERERLSQASPVRDVIGGALLGLTLFTSMLPALVVAAVLLHVTATRPLRAVVRTAAGFLLGLLPLAVYNAIQFGHPLLQANIAGDYSDTFFSPDAERFVKYLRFYFGLGKISALKYEPIALLAVVGWCRVPERLRPARRMALGAIALHLCYVLNIETVGHCQYGPRYLLPVLPFLLLGFPFVHALSSRYALGFAAVWAVAAYSGVVNLAGALSGVMYCELPVFGPIFYLASPEPRHAHLEAALLVATLGLGVLGTWLLGRGGLGGGAHSRGGRFVARAALLALTLVGMEAVARTGEREKRPAFDEWRRADELLLDEPDGLAWAPGVDVSPDGVRDRPHVVDRPPGLRRVAVLGDGLGVGHDLRLDQTLVGRLQQEADPLVRAIEFLSFAHQAWATPQMRIAYERLARKYRPDTVVLGVAPEHVGEMQNSAAPRRGLRVLSVFESLFAPPAPRLQGIDELLERGAGPAAAAGFERLRAEIARLRDAVRGDGGTLVVLIFPEGDPAGRDPRAFVERVASTAQSLGLRSVDATGPLGQRGMRVFSGMRRLSETGNQEVAHCLIASGVLPTVAPAETGDPIAALSSPEPLARAAAARRLGANDESAMPVLFAALRDPSGYVRLRAAEALLRLGPGPEHVDPLVTALQDPDPYVSTFGAWSLGQLGPAAGAAIPALRAALDRPEAFGRDGAAPALVEVHSADPVLIEKAIATMKGPDPTRRWQAARVLSRCGAAASPALPALIDALDAGEDRLRLFAVRAIVALGPLGAPARAALRHAADEPAGRVRKEAIQALQALRAPSAR